MIGLSNEDKVALSHTRHKREPLMRALLHGHVSVRHMMRKAVLLKLLS